MGIYDKKYFSPNFGYPKGTDGRRGYEIVGVGVHISGAEWQSNYSWIMNPSSNASYNAIIQRDGSIVSLVPESNAAYSHGRINKPDWPFLKAGVNPNLYTLSVARVGSNQNTWDKPQMDSTVRLILHWADKYGFKPEWPYVFGHKNIDSVDRWYCPGTPFLDALYVELAKAVAAPMEPSVAYRIIVSSHTRWEDAEASRRHIQQLFPTHEPFIVRNIVHGTYWFRVVLREVERHDQARAVIDAVKRKGLTAWSVAEWEDLDFDIPGPEPEEPIEEPIEEPEDPVTELPSGLLALLRRLYDLLKILFRD